MKKGLLAAALAAILTLSTLTACGGTGTDGSGQEDLPRLVIASDNYEPYSYVGPNGNLIGVDVDLATEACRRLGYAPEFCQIVWENKDAYLSSGQADCLWGSFTMTGREDLYQWAGPYLYSRQMVAVRANSDIHTLADLAGPPGGGSGHGQAGGALSHLQRAGCLPGGGGVLLLHHGRGIRLSAQGLCRCHRGARERPAAVPRLLPGLLPHFRPDPGRVPAGGGLSKEHP